MENHPPKAPSMHGGNCRRKATEGGGSAQAQRHSVSGRFTWGSCPARSAKLSPKTVKNADSKLSSCAERPSASCRARIAAVVTHIPPEELDSAKWNTPFLLVYDRAEEKGSGERKKDTA